MGLHLIGIVPSISGLGIHFPKSWTEKFLTSKNPIFAPLLGVITFFIPCGFTLSMQLVAVSTGSFRSG
jgi:sulfite exporter TauE/SafE